MSKAVKVVIIAILVIILIAGFFLRMLRGDSTVWPPKFLMTVIGDPRNESHLTASDLLVRSFVGDYLYYKFANSVYCYNSGVDMNGNYSEYWWRLPGSDASTFKIIDSNYSKDKNNVYGKSRRDEVIACDKVKDADPETFTPLDYPYAKDKNNVYYNLVDKIDGADPATFKVLLNRDCAKDKNNYYLYGQIDKKNKCQ